MYSFEEKRRWKRKDNFGELWLKESCAYCFFDCSPELCDERDYFCDNFLPND